MDGRTAEAKLSRRIKALVAVAGLAAAAVSILYLLVAATPLYYFHGYVRGHYSPLSYELYYSHSGLPILMPHTDYVKHVSATFALLSAALLVASLASIVLVKKSLTAASELAYGASLGTVVLYGLLHGYLYRVVNLDMSMFNNMLKESLTYRTLAGTITFEGIRVEQTLVHKLAFALPVLLTLLAVAVLASALAAGLALSAFYKHAPTEGPPLGLRRFSAYLVLFLMSFTLIASAFAYYPSSLAAIPQPPPATLEAPPYACLARTSRAAVVYTDFETYPLPGWATSGGTWSSASGVAGAKGNALRGADDDRGVGGASHYYYNTDLSSYTSLWVVEKTRYHAGPKAYYGVSLMNSDRNRLFTVEVYRFAAARGYLVVRSYGVTAAGWVTHASVEIPGYNQVYWYIIALRYSVSGATITITAYLYDASGNIVATASATVTHANVFTPAYIGVEVDEGTAYFDDFLIATADPRGVTFTNLQANMTVEVWDNLGNLVSFGRSEGTSLSLGVAHDVVVGTGVDGRVVVRNPDGSLLCEYRVPTTDAILGGDVYRVEAATVVVELGANKTSTRVSVRIPSSPPGTAMTVLRMNASQILYARLVLEDISAPAALNLDIWIEGAARSTNITVRNGAPISTSTSVVQLNLGLNNDVVLAGYFTASGQAATLSLKLELYTAPGGMGARASYPIVITLSS